MKNKNLIGEFWGFLKERKAWWFGLIILMLLISSISVISIHSSALSPLIYALF